MNTLSCNLLLVVTPLSFNHKTDILGQITTALHVTHVKLSDCLLLNPYPVNKFLSWPKGYDTFFLLNSTEHKIYHVHKCKNGTICWHFLHLLA